MCSFSLLDYKIKWVKLDLHIVCWDVSCVQRVCDVYYPNSLILGIAEKLRYHDQIAGVGSQTKYNFQVSSYRSGHKTTNLRNF
jgi:hypothetical protein